MERRLTDGSLCVDAYPDLLLDAHVQPPAAKTWSNMAAAGPPRSSLSSSSCSSLLKHPGMALSPPASRFRASNGASKAADPLGHRPLRWPSTQIGSARTTNSTNPGEVPVCDIPWGLEVVFRCGLCASTYRGTYRMLGGYGAEILDACFTFVYHKYSHCAPIAASQAPTAHRSSRGP